MFDIGWTEMVVVAVVAILVVGPKDLPGMLRAFGKTIGNLRRMAGDFQRQFDDALKEAELDDVKKLSKSTSFKPLQDARKSMESFQKSMNEPMAVESGVKEAAKGGEPASAEAKPAAPAKRGATSKAAGKGSGAKSTKAKAPAKKPGNGAKANGSSKSDAAKTASKLPAKPASKAPAKRKSASKQSASPGAGA